MLLSVRNPKHPANVEHADVPRVEPTLLVDDFLGPFVVEIAEHDVWISRQNFAVIRNLYRNARDWLSNGSKLRVVESVDG